MFKRVAMAGALLAAGAGLTGCVDDGYGYGGPALGYAAPGYGYDQGYGYAGGYGYGDYYGDGYGYGYPGDYFGWYGGFYYPGTGYYVYDRYRRPYRWNGTQQRYWQNRGQAYRNSGGRSPQWRGFSPQTGSAYHGQQTFGQRSGQATQGARAPVSNGGGSFHGGGGGFHGGGQSHR